MNSLKLKIAILIQVLTVHFGYSSDIINVNDEIPFKIGHYVKFYLDHNNRITIEDLIKNPNIISFKKNSQENLNFGVSNATLWLKFKINNKTEKELGLMPGRNFIDSICLYTIHKDQYSKKLYGTGIKQINRDFKVHDYIFRLEEADFYYLKIRNTSGPLLIKPKIGSVQKLLKISYLNAKNFGIYFGLVAVLSIYSLVIFVFSKQVSSLLYLGFLIFLSLHVSKLIGTTTLFLPESLLLAISKNHFFTLLMLMIFGFAFLVNFLSLKRRVFWFYNTGLFWIALSLIIFAISLLGNKAYLFNIWLKTALFFVLVLVLTFIFLSFKYGSVTRIITIGFFFFGLGTFIFMMEQIGIIVGNNFTENGFVIGNGIEMICFAIAMAVQSIKHKKEKELSQKKALQLSKNFSHNLIETQENERKRIAGELHDGIGQSLIILKNKMLLLQQNRLNETLNDVAENISDTIHDVRTISYALRPHKLDAFGLTASIEDLIEDNIIASDTDISYKVENIDKLLSSNQEINVYRIIQEILNNTNRHSKSTKGNVLIKNNKASNLISIELSDNGIGFNTEQKTLKNKSGFGLKGIQERIESMDGFWNIKSQINNGTHITIIIPIYGNK